MKQPNVRVGVAGFILKGNQFLVGLRTGSHGADTWALPGGHVEWKESPEATIKREILEETGLVATHPQKLAFTNDIFEKDNKHYITLFYTLQYTSGVPERLEPNKCLEWKWMELSELQTWPNPLFVPMDNFLKDPVAVAELQKRLENQ